MKGRSRRKPQKSPRGKLAAFLVLCLVCVTVLPAFTRDGPITAEAATEIYVTDKEEFIEALNNAEDGDAIVIAGVITIDESIEIGSASKQLTVKRYDENSYLRFNSGMVEVVNVAFDGSDIKTQYSMIYTYTDTVFYGCYFYNCGITGASPNTSMYGGAVRSYSDSCIFNGCTFTDNHAMVGGAVYVSDHYSAVFNDCIFTDNSTVAQGGAICASTDSHCEINGGIITGNHGDVGGGVCNAGTMTISGVKIYNNTAGWAGADIATRVTGSTILTDSIEDLNELFSDEDIEVYGWINDYDASLGSTGDFDPTQENSLLKLDYGYIEDDPEPEETEPDETEPEETEPVETEPEESEPEETESPETEAEDDEGEKGGGSLASSSDAERKESDSDQADDGSDEVMDAGSGDSASESVTSDSGSKNTSNASDSTSSTSSGSSGRSNSSNSTSSHSSGGSGGSSGASSATVVATYSVGPNASEESETAEETEAETAEASEIVETVESYEQYAGTTETIVTILDPPRQTGNVYYVRESNGASAEPSDRVTEAESASETAAESPDASEATIETDAEETETVEQIEQVKPAEAEKESPNIRIDAKSVDCLIEFTDGEYNISINGSATAEAKAGFDWLNIIQCVLLVGILACFIWKPKE